MLMQDQTNWIRPSESGAWTLAFGQSSLEFAAAQWVLWSLALEPQAPALALLLETLIFRTKCHLLVWAKTKTKVTGITSCKNSLEHILLGEKKRSFCLGSADKKESSVCFFYSETNLTLNSLTQEKESSGIWRKQMDPGLQSREECLGNQKNIMVLYKFLVRFQPAALSWILCKTPGMLMNWKVNWIITGLRPYCDDEVRRKKNRFTVRGREEMKEEEVYGVCQRTEERVCCKASARMMIHSKTIKHVFPSAKKEQGIWFRSEEGKDWWRDYDP